MTSYRSGHITCVQNKEVPKEVSSKPIVNSECHLKVPDIVSREHYFSVLFLAPKEENGVGQWIAWIAAVGLNNPNPEHKLKTQQEMQKVITQIR